MANISQIMTFFVYILMCGYFFERKMSLIFGVSKSIEYLCQDEFPLSVRGGNGERKSFNE